MKKRLFGVVLLTGILLSACSNDDMETATPGTQQETALEHAEKHQDPKYVCPMHPQIVRDKPGNCPICGMDLVKKEPEQASQAGQAGGEKKILYWVAPMDPSYRRDGPGKSPMGMDLVPVYDEGEGLAVKISPAVENNMGVRTAVVERNKLWRKIDTVGYVDFDENKISHIHVRTKGWVEKLEVFSEGERVKKGQLLFELYSPDLVNAQDEYLQALQSGSRQLTRAAYERLLALGISERQVKAFTKSRRISQYVQFYAPQDGIVAKLNLREGMYVTPSMDVMTLADLSSVWIMAEVFESQANWVQVGQPADVHLSYVPGRLWEGKVGYIYPSLNPQTRTLKVRLEFDNSKETLKPNMFAEVAIYGGPKKDVVIIPREALIRTGGDTRVILKTGEGRFQPREVVVGIESGDWIEIQTGLQPGDIVVTSGQFLIDSEASLKASLQRMQAPEKTAAPRQTGPSADTTEMEMKPAAEKITGTGIVREIPAGEHRIKLSHEPIPALKWPQMTMFFQVNPDIKLDSFAVDDKVEFELQQTDEGYVIKAMREMTK